MRHSVAVVRHANQPLSALLNLDANRVGTRIQSVLEQFLDDGSRPLHHLARGDFVGHSLWQYANAAHWNLE